MPPTPRPVVDYGPSGVGGRSASTLRSSTKSEKMQFGSADTVVGIPTLLCRRDRLQIFSDFVLAPRPSPGLLFHHRAWGGGCVRAVLAERRCFVSHFILVFSCGKRQGGWCPVASLARAAVLRARWVAFCAKVCPGEQALAVSRSPAWCGACGSTWWSPWVTAATIDAPGGQRLLFP